MATISRIKAGQVLYDKHKYKMGNTTMSRWGLWKVFVKEVDVEGKYIIASWNGNPPHKMCEQQVKKLMVNKPKLK